MLNSDNIGHCYQV